MWSCAYFDRTDKVPLAKVGDEVLFLSEVQSVIPDHITAEDSILLAADYIQKWIRTELLVKKAQENLTIAQRDVSRELEEYRNSLIIYRYQKELMAEKMDTSVTMNEITEYYEKHVETFPLNTDLVKAVYIKIPLQVSHPERARAFCENPSRESLREMQAFCSRYAVDYKFYTDQWIEAGTVFRDLPDVPGDLGSLISSDVSWETQDNQYYYLVCIYGHRMKGDSAPLEYVRENIKNLIINDRKTAFLKKIENDIYTEGVRNNKFKIYEYETN
jgi:hypothetical protein